MIERLGIYEKALPKHLSITEKLKLAKRLGFSFIEMSIDETDERLARLNWKASDIEDILNTQLEHDIRIQSICLSGHRRFPFGSQNDENRKQAESIMVKAIDLAEKLGVRVIQLAGYDVYYEEKSDLTHKRFIEGLRNALSYAHKKQILLAIEIMDDKYMNSITKYLKIKSQINHPMLQVYPDIGNLSAWPENNVKSELAKGISDIAAIHLKDTKSVTEDYPGKFKEVTFGDGCVDFVEAFKTLDKLDYTGPYLIEMWSENSKLAIEEIKEAVQFIEKQYQLSKV